MKHTLSFVVLAIASSFAIATVWAQSPNPQPAPTSPRTIIANPDTRPEPIDPGMRPINVNANVDMQVDSQGSVPEVVVLIQKERKLEADSHKLLNDYRRATTDGDRKQQEDLLRRVLADQFAVKQSLREREINRLEAEVKKLRGTLQQRNNESGRIIEERLQQMLRDANGLGWGSNDAGHSPDFFGAAAQTEKFRTLSADIPVKESDRLSSRAQSDKEAQDAGSKSER